MEKEKLPIQLNELSPIIIALVEKIQLLDTDLPTNQQINFTKDLSQVVENFRQFFAKAAIVGETGELKKIFNERIETAFSQFEWDANVGTSPFDPIKLSQNSKKLVSSVLKILDTKGCEILIIETYLKLCLKVVVEMAENVDPLVDKIKYKLLLETFSRIADLFKKYWHVSFLPNQKNVIVLCLYQICKGLPFLLKMIQVHNANMKQYALNLLNKCLIRLTEEIHRDGDSQAKSCGQEFITLMDHCLYKLNEVSNYANDHSNFVQKASETARSLKPIIDELLCYVMSIAHVTTFENDHSAIVTESHKVLSEFNNFNNEITRKNAYETKLNASSVGETLCCLERQVNIAVLRLVLEIFSGVNSPLKKIVNKCKADIARGNKATEDLDDLISEFDLEMDRIMQIGFFAMSCTKSLNRILRIQSCLASLESLETDLIPSLTALYIDCNAKNKANFQCLVEFWLSEITELKIIIDSVLDPACFSEVVLKQIKSLVSILKDDKSSTTCTTKAKTILKQIIRYSRKLVKTLKTNLEDENGRDDRTVERLKTFLSAIKECEAVLDLLDNDEDANKTMSRALKRCDLLLATLQNLSLHLFDLVSNEESKFDATEKPLEDTPYPDLQIPQGSYYKLCNSVDASLTPSDLELLTPYINKGICLSKKRNILYTTPSRAEKELEDSFDLALVQARHWDKTPVSHKRSRYCKPLNLNLELENTIDLEITNIVENVSRLNSEFHKSLSEKAQKQSKVEIDQEKSGKDIACGTEKDIDYVKPVYMSSGCCAKLDLGDKPSEATDDEEDSTNVLGNKFRNDFLQSLNDLSQCSSLSVSKHSDTDTPDRLNDLKIVEEKINFLKQQVPGVLP